MVSELVEHLGFAHLSRLAVAVTGFYPVDQVQRHPPSSETQTLGFGRVWLGAKSLELSYVDQVDHRVGVYCSFSLGRVWLGWKPLDLSYGSRHKRIPNC